MSRPKSAARIQADIDKAIRKKRRECKRQEHETRRKERERKRATHESIVKNNGISPIQSGGEKLGLRDAMTYSPLVLCGGCGVIVREDSLIDGFCPGCKYGEEVVDSPDVLKAKQGDALTGVHHGPLEAQDERRRA